MQLNTATSGYLNGLSALRHLYEGLYKLDAEGNVVLGQAASVEESDDKLPGPLPYEMILHGLTVRQ